MTDSLQDYFANLMGCGGSSFRQADIVTDNARVTRRQNSSSYNGSSSSHLDWWTTCCSMNTSANATACFSRWDSEPPPRHCQQDNEHQLPVKRDVAIQRPRQRPMGEGSESIGEEHVTEDYNAIFLPTEEALDGININGRSNTKRHKPICLPMRPSSENLDHPGTRKQ